MNNDNYKWIYDEVTKKRKTYSDMITFCCDNLILNNEIKLQHNYFFSEYCRSEYDEENDEYIEIFQYYMISENDAENLARWTNEIVIYNEEINIYLLCVAHYGTSWNSIPANWKTIDEYIQDNTIIDKKGIFKIC